MALIERIASEGWGIERAVTERWRPLKRAKDLLTSFLSESVAAPSAPLPRSASPTASRTTWSELLDDPRFTGIGAVHQDDGVLVSWRTDAEQLESVRSIAAGARSLRIVVVRAAEGGEVHVDTVDLGEVAAEGARLLPEVPGLLRAVASIGLFDGTRFVSMAHGSVA